MKVIALDKVIVAELIWRNQFNNISLRNKPTVPTVNGMKVDDSYAGYHYSFPQETMLERAKRLDILDRFIPVFIAKAQGGIRYEALGKRALSLWEAWKAMQFNKHKTNDKRRNKKAAREV